MENHFRLLSAAVIVIVIANGASVASEPQGWPMLGGSVSRDHVARVKTPPPDFDPEKGTNVLWRKSLGAMTYGSPVVGDGKVFIGTNNWGKRKYRDQYEGDFGVLLAFEAESGDFLWQLARPYLKKRPDDYGRLDMPGLGISTTPVVEGERLWVVTNRQELMCLDTRGFRDGENDGPFQDEDDKEQEGADIVWNLDMFGELNVMPHEIARSSPLVFGDLVYVLTCQHGTSTYEANRLPLPPEIVAVNKKTGKVVWRHRSAGATDEGQWNSPALGIVNGEPQVYYASSDGWLFALSADKGEEIWRFNCSPRDDPDAPVYIYGTPAFSENSVVVGCHERNTDVLDHTSVGHVYRIDASMRGDVTQKALIWRFGGKDPNDAESSLYRKNVSGIAVGGGFVLVVDLEGWFHCLDFATGKRFWEADVLGEQMAAPVIVGDKVYLTDGEGKFGVYALSKKPADDPMEQAIKTVYVEEDWSFSTVAVVEERMYIAARHSLIAVGKKAED